MRKGPVLYRFWAFVFAASLIFSVTGAHAADIASYVMALDRLEAQIFQNADHTGRIYGDPDMRQGEVVFDDQGRRVSLGSGPGWLFAVTPIPGTDTGSLLVFVREDGATTKRSVSFLPDGLKPTPAPVKAAATAPTNRDEAYALLLERLLGHSSQGRRVFVRKEPINSPEAIALVQGRVTLSGGSGWVFFVDDIPMANWAHGCRYVLVSETGAMEIARASWPPRDMDKFEELTDWPTESLVTPKNLKSVLQGASKGATPAANRYAVILSGGISAAQNYSRYWNDCAYFYATLIDNGFLADNIFVIYADGVPKTSDMPVHYSATKANIATVFDNLATRIGSDDILYIFTTDHGGNNEDTNPYPYENSDVVLCLWDHVNMTNAEFAAEVNKVSPRYLVAIFEQCFSGGMIEPLKDATKKRVLMSAARFWELSYASSTLDYDEFSYHLTTALADPAIGDSNGDGVVTMEEAYFHALASDSNQSEELDPDNFIEGEHPVYYSNPWDLGRKIGLGGEYPAAPAPVYAGYSQHQISDPYPTGGTAMGFTQNDSTLGYALPFFFLFNGHAYTSVTVSSNGQLFFGKTSTTSGLNSINGIRAYQVVAPMWDLLSIVGTSGDGVYVTTDETSSVTFAWKAHTRADATPREINAAVKLSSNGQIRFLYGAGNNQTSLVAQRDKTIGLSKGAGTACHYALRNGVGDLGEAKGILFRPGTAWNPSLMPILDLLLLQ